MQNTLLDVILPRLLRVVNCLRALDVVGGGGAGALCAA